MVSPHDFQVDRRFPRIERAVAAILTTEGGTVRELICTSIEDHVLLEFDYEGLHRVVAPYCHGFTGRGEVLRAVQVRGESRSRGFRFGKLWLIEKMRNLRRTDESFVPDDPDYNPNDSAMTRIHCRLRR